MGTENAIASCLQRKTPLCLHCDDVKYDACRLLSRHVLQHRPVPHWLDLLTSMPPLSHTYKSKQKTDKQVLKMISDCWMRCLTLQMDTLTYTAVLECFHHTIIPRVTEPQRLMDFCVDAYNQGGVVSILALNGLFTLIHSFNLDYPMFYDKLYYLLDAKILHCKYRSRFFRLVSLFLSSTYSSLT